ncbi:MAG: hypothetical protein WAK04_02180 [Xanthobacteraceae bacterium]
MNKSEPTDSDAPVSGLLRQGTAFIRDFAAFAGLSGVMASALAVIAATFEGAGLLLLVPLLSLITASDTGTGWTHRFLMQAFEIAGAQTRSARLSLLLGLFAGSVVIRAIIVARRNIMLTRIEWALSKPSAPASPGESPPRPGRWYRARSMRASPT